MFTLLGIHSTYIKYNVSRVPFLVQLVEGILLLLSF